MATVLRIIDWDKNFETAESRKIGRLTWVAVPLKRGTGYKRLLMQDDGPALLGAWIAIVEFAATCFVRGLLCRENGRPYKAMDIAVTMDLPVKLIQQALDSLSNTELEIDWIETIDDQAALKLIQDKIDTERGKKTGKKHAATDAAETLTGNAPGATPGIDAKTGTESRPHPENDQKPGLHNKTGHNTTKPDNHSSPTSSQSAQQPVRSSTGQPATWAEVAVAMKDLKVSRVTETIKAATANGFTPPQVLALIDVVKLAASNPNCTSPGGALVDRLKTSHAVEWNADECWPWSSQVGANPPPPASPYEVPDEVSAAEAKRREAEDLQRDRDFIAELGRLELSHGATLNAMSRDELQVLMATAGPAAQAMLRRDYTAKGRDSPDVRPTLLKLLENRKPPEGKS